MAFSSTLTVDGDHEYTVMYMRFELHQTVDDAMSVTSPIQWAHLYVEVEMVLDDFLVEWASKPSQKYDLSIEQFGEHGSFKTLSFKDAVCIEFVEMFDDGSDDLDIALTKRLENFITCLTITASNVEVDEAKLENF
ncbi:type VI secretion system tube protein TssD [Dyadobacter sp. 3J3]|uniref:type VI secretion system tube protein TssD n=1 Tax=Dyadobacter sp. 3J3 TaxID=2606600 RepID=UPI00135933B0|nr:type VI secretion system tube protein TssD [Dyadobacter sp. 3J3]